jgi:hypothetical protein
MRYLAIFMLLCLPCWAATYYADAAGDGGVGSEADPFNEAQMQTAATVAAGSTVYCTGAFATMSFLNTNAKGTSRPQGAADDIGAYEYVAPVAGSKLIFIRK